MAIHLQLTPAVLVALAGIALGQSDSLQGKLTGLSQMQSPLSMQNVDMGAVIGSSSALQDMTSKVINVFMSRVPAQFLASDGTFGGQGFPDIAEADRAGLMQALQDASVNDGMWGSVANSGAVNALTDPEPIDTGHRTQFIF